MERTKRKTSRSNPTTYTVSNKFHRFHLDNSLHRRLIKNWASTQIWCLATMWRWSRWCTTSIIPSSSFSRFSISSTWRASRATRLSKCWSDLAQCMERVLTTRRLWLWCRLKLMLMPLAAFCIFSKWLKSPRAQRKKLITNSNKQLQDAWFMDLTVWLQLVWWHPHIQACISEERWCRWVHNLLASAHTLEACPLPLKNSWDTLRNQAQRRKTNKTILQ